MAQLCGGLFVNVVDDKFCSEHGFSKTLNYPVLAIETVSYGDYGDAGDAPDDSTEFLLSNPKGEFYWVSMSKVRRASQKPQASHRTMPSRHAVS